MGRYSRYPAINREISPVTPEESSNSGEDTKEVIDTAPVVEVIAPVEVPDEPEPEVTEEATEADKDDDEEAPEADNASDDLAEMSAREVLAWVGDDPDRRQVALALEQQGRGRKTLIRKLREA